MTVYTYEEAIKEYEDYSGHRLSRSEYRRIAAEAKDRIEFGRIYETQSWWCDDSTDPRVFDFDEEWVKQFKRGNP